MRSHSNRTGRQSNGSRRLALAIASTLAAASTATPALEFVVNSSTDDGPGSLRAAITQANAAPGTDQISFSGVSEITLNSGQIDITDDLIINGPDEGVVISGNGNSRIFGVTQQGASLSLGSVVLINGRAENAGGGTNCGAGAPRGGAICSLGPLGLRSSRILDSESVDSRGGAIFVATDGLVSLEDCALIGNTALAQGGAADIVAGNLIVSNCTISANVTTNTSAYGGALYVTAPTSINRTTFSGNQTSGVNADGAALWTRSDTLIDNSTFSGNATLAGSADGAAIFSRDGNLSLRSVTVTDNASAAGGAITFDDNNGRSFDLLSSILAGNPGPAGNLLAFADLGGPITVNVTASVFGDAPGEIDGDSFANFFTDDPGVLALADNGCAIPAGVSGANVVPPAACTATHRPELGSIVIDSGQNLVDAFDQRGSGFPRDTFNGPDIGAIEFQGEIGGPPPVPPPTPSVPVPTLSTSMLALLAGLIGLAGVITTRRRAAAS
jgi:hypothetical protein